jgi:hypothetical protein
MAKPYAGFTGTQRMSLKKLLDFFDSDMLQLFDFALRPYRSNYPRRSGNALRMRQGEAKCEAGIRRERKIAIGFSLGDSQPSRSSPAAHR